MEHIFWGTPVVSGYAFARAKWVGHVQLPDFDSNFRLEDGARAGEYARFEAAAAAVAKDLRQRSKTTVGAGSDIIMATAQIAEDPGLVSQVKPLIMDSGYSAHHAIWHVMDSFIEQYHHIGGLMLERIADVENARDRLVAHLHGIVDENIGDLDEPTVILADDLTPVDTAGMDPAIVKGIVTRQGGPTSHTSIIARQLGIPCIVATRHLPDDHALKDYWGPSYEHIRVFVDAVSGCLDLNPDRAYAAQRVAAFEDELERAARWSGPAVMASGESIDLLVNVQEEESALNPMAQKASGVGLYRTELTLMSRYVEPSIDDQVNAIRGVLRAFAGKKVIIRTLDAGSDKPVRWLPLEPEQNPALGVRGLRTSGPLPLPLFHQLDAIAKASEGHEGVIGVMAPMVSTLAEASWFSDIVHQRGLRAGIMIETPSSAIMADQILPAVDFVSIGTNDLTQYVMAADRLNPSLATYTDTWQPAVLRLVRLVVDAGVRSGVPVGICGEAAADPVLACVFLGLGVSSLSMAPAAIPKVGALLEQVTMESCQKAAKAVRGARDPGDARNRAREALGLD